MYREYQIMQRLLHYRTTPKGPWIMMNYESLSHITIDLMEENRNLIESSTALNRQLRDQSNETKLDIIAEYLSRTVELLEELNNETST